MRKKLVLIVTTVHWTVVRMESNKYTIISDDIRRTVIEYFLAHNVGHEFVWRRDKQRETNIQLSEDSVARVVGKAGQTERNQHSTQWRQHGTSCEGGTNREKPTINQVKTAWHELLWRRDKQRETNNKPSEDSVARVVVKAGQTERKQQSTKWRQRGARVVVKARSTGGNQHSTQWKRRGTSCCEGAISRRKPTFNSLKTAWHELLWRRDKQRETKNQPSEDSDDGAAQHNS
jgi:hypothetical protein